MDRFPGFAWKEPFQHLVGLPRPRGAVKVAWRTLGTLFPEWRDLTRRCGRPVGFAGGPAWAVARGVQRADFVAARFRPRLFRTSWTEDRHARAGQPLLKGRGQGNTVPLDQAQPLEKYFAIFMEVTLMPTI